MQIYRFRKSTVSQILILFSILSLTAACGGGGSGSDSSPSSSNQAPSQMQVQFSQTVVNHFQDKFVTIQNQGTKSQTIGTVAQADPIGEPFSIMDDQCSGATLAPSGTCTLGIRFLPLSQNTFDDTFDIPSDAGQTLMNVKLSGKAVSYNVSINQVDVSACPTIKLLVTVTDSNDDPVISLSQDDFSLSEDGKLQDLRNFSQTVSGPISVALVLDYSNSIQPYISDVENGANSFLGQLDLDNNTDEAAIIKFSAGIGIKQPFTDVSSSLHDAIYNDPFSGNTDQTFLYDAVWQAVDITSDPLRNDRRAVVVLTDGIDEGSVDHDFADVVEKANESGVPIFTIGLGNTFLPPLQAMADESGGQFFSAPTSDDLQSIYQQIAQILTNQYEIEYQSSSTGSNIIDLNIKVVDGNGLEGDDSKSVTGCP
jgi:Ca-activated chloride channel homolog